MTELMGWVTVLGFIITIAGIFMLSIQIERHTQSMIAMLLRSNEMLLAKVERLMQTPPAEPEVTPGVILERRHAERRIRQPEMNRAPDRAEQRRSSGRRAGDIPATAPMGFVRP